MKQPKKIGRPFKSINWTMVENLVQFGCKQEFVAYELARDNGIARPDKKDISAYTRTLNRRLSREFGMSFVQYRDFFKDKIKTAAWKVYLDETLNRRNPRLIKDLMDRLEGKPQEHVKLTGDSAQPIHVEVKRTNYDNLSAEELLQLEIIAKKLEANDA